MHGSGPGAKPSDSDVSRSSMNKKIFVASYAVLFDALISLWRNSKGTAWIITFHLQASKNRNNARVQ